jgi:hypothetical protein
MVQAGRLLGELEERGREETWSRLPSIQAISSIRLQATVAIRTLVVHRVAPVVHRVAPVAPLVAPVAPAAGHHIIRHAANEDYRSLYSPSGIKSRDLLRGFELRLCQNSPLGPLKSEGLGKQ